MGQYRQWLHYRDIDHRLRQQREQLIQQRTQLQERLEQATLAQPDTDNSIFEALLQRMQAGATQLIPPSHTPVESDRVPSIEHALPPHAIQLTSLPATQSPTEGQQKGGPPPNPSHIQPYAQPYAQSQPTHTSNYAPGYTPNPGTPLPPVYAPLPPLPPPPSSTPPASSSTPSTSAQQTPYQQSNLLPEDMNSFLDAYSQTEPQVAIPWWLQRAASNASNGSLDPQSAQTNRLVQRWLERWGKQPPHEDQETQNGHQ